MKAVQITWKSTICRKSNEFKDATEYRVLFTDIPEYAKKQWLEIAKDVCPDAELTNPMLEMYAVLHPNGDMSDIRIAYYFDDYVDFELTDEDEEQMCSLFTEICNSEGSKLPDAYNAETDELLSEWGWKSLVDDFYGSLVSDPSNVSDETETVLPEQRLKVLLENALIVIRDEFSDNNLDFNDWISEIEAMLGTTRSELESLGIDIDRIR